MEKQLSPTEHYTTLLENRNKQQTNLVSKTTTTQTKSIAILYVVLQCSKTLDVIISYTIICVINTHHSSVLRVGFTDPYLISLKFYCISIHMQNYLSIHKS